MARALITGITGQDGAYLSKLLLEKGYEVYGGRRHGASPNTWRLEELGILDQIKFEPLEMLEYSNIVHALDKIQPDEIYNLAAHSFVQLSFVQPTYLAEVNAMGVLRLLEAIRQINPKIKFYQASTSEMFGKVAETPQSETTPFRPRSPYGAAKLHAHWATINYREAHGIFACCGILFNHESPLRGIDFVTRKITHGLARIVKHDGPSLRLGNLDAKRDWGFAGDYVDGMWRMMQQDEPKDYVLATGKTYSVGEFLHTACEIAGINLHWDNDGQAHDQHGKHIVTIDLDLYRPAEVDILLGDSALARRDLGWTPEVGLMDLVAMMWEADLARA